MIRSILMASAALVLSAGSALAQCDVSKEVTEVAAAFQAEMAELTGSANPDIARITMLSEMLNGAGAKASAGDTAGACADYAKLREELAK